MNTHKGKGTKDARVSTENARNGVKEKAAVKSSRFTVRHRAGKVPLMMHDMADCTGEGDCIHEQGIAGAESIASLDSIARRDGIKSVDTITRVDSIAKAKVEPVAKVKMASQKKVRVAKRIKSVKVSTENMNTVQSSIEAPATNQNTGTNSQENPLKNVVQLHSVKKVVENNRRIFTGGIIATLVAGIIAGSTFGIGKMLPANTDVVTFVTGALTTNHADQLSKQGKTSDAILEYEKAIQQSPNDLNAYKKLATIYEMDTREWSKAIKTLNDAVMISDNDADVYRLLSYAQLWAGQSEDAAKSAQKAIDLRRGDALVTSTMALAVAAGGDLSKGKDMMQQALSMDGNNERVDANAALFYRVYAKDNDKAEELIRKAIKISPDDASNYWELANLMKDESKTGDAEAALRKSLALQPESGFRADDLADYLSSSALKKYSEAADMYRKAIAQGYDDVSVVDALGAALFNAGKYTDAAAEYQKLVKLEPNNADHVLMLGRSQFESKNYSAAKDTFTKLVGMNASASSYNWLGCANYGLGEYDTAINNFNASLKLNNGDATTWANLANATDKTGNTFVAAGYALNALDYDANNSVAWVVLDQIGNHMIANNQKDMARDLFSQATKLFVSEAPGRAQVLADLSRIQ